MKRKLLFIMLAYLFLWTSATLAQVSKVAGVVISEEGNEPVVGASILVKGFSQGVITNVNGEFTLTNVPNDARTLIISFVGMKTQEVAIKPQLRIIMSNDSQMLDEVIVTVAYGTAKKSSLTGAISSVNQDQIEMRPTSSVTSALEGTTSGVQINSTYGAPGSDPSIRIRGIGTVNGSSTPLYVVDGVPFGGNISDINPADIESISVLKDAASAALYGNRASNGVILISTRKGTSNKISFDLKINQGVYSRGIKEYKRTSPNQFMEASWQNLKNARMSAGDDAATAAKYASESLISEQLYLNIYNKADNALFDANGNLVSDAQILPGYADDLDWYSDAIRNGYRQEYSFSGNTANEKSNYYFSIGYLDEKGYVTNSDFNRISARTSMSFTPKKWFKAGINLSGTHQNSHATNGDSDAGYIRKFAWQRSAIDRYKLAVTSAVRVNALCHGLLAGTVGTEYQHRHIRRGYYPRVSLHLKYFRAGTSEQVFRFRADSRERTEYLFRQFKQVFPVYRLGQIVFCPQLDGAYRIRYRPVFRCHYEWNVFLLFCEPL